MHGVSKFQQIQRQAARARKLQEEEFKKNQSIFVDALAEIEDPPESSISANDETSGDDLFGEIDKALALKRKEFVKQGLLKPNPKKNESQAVSGAQTEADIDELEPEEEVDLEEIKELSGLTEISEDDDAGGSEEEEEEESSERSDFEASNELNNAEFSDLSSFDIDFDEFGKSKARIVEPKFRMSLAELLDESKVVPVSVYGNLEVEISGIQHDSRLVESGDLFVCCVGRNTDGHL